MKKRKVRPIVMAFAMIVLLVVAFLVRLSTHRAPRVVLPAEEQESVGSGVSDGPSGAALNRVEVTRETVQDAVATLTRPDNYRRSVAIERYFDGGSGVSTADVRVLGGWTRADISADGWVTRHVVVGDGRCWVWYGEDERTFSSAAAFSADEELGIPTYETVVGLDPARIAAADYRSLDGEACIYVETAPDDAGYTESWWVSVDSGLLSAAEKRSGDEVVYRMTAAEVSAGTVGAEDFILPDGTAPIEPENEAPPPDLPEAAEAKGED